MSEDLVDRLMSLAEEHFEMLDNIHEPLAEAADEIERLRGALRWIEAEALAGDGVLLELIHAKAYEALEGRIGTPSGRVCRDE